MADSRQWIRKAVIEPGEKDPVASGFSSVASGFSRKEEKIPWLPALSRKFKELYCSHASSFFRQHG
jgi:hypothetical protein